MTKPLLPEERKIGFWLNVEKLPGDGCWLWKGQINSSGYGQCSYKGRTMMAHRASWIMANGPIPKGLLVLHKCDVRSCVRQDHLFLGTHKDNMDDMYRKGRGPVKDKNGSQTKPWRRAFGDRNGSRTCPESRPRGDAHWTRQHPEKISGSRNPNAHLTDGEIELIRRLYESGMLQTELAKMFKTSQPHISRLVLKKQRR